VAFPLHTRLLLVAEFIRSAHWYSRRARIRRSDIAPSSYGATMMLRMALLLRGH